MDCTAAIDVILKNYSVLCEELDLLEEEAQGESSHKALGTDVSFLFSLASSLLLVLY